ncbi:MAG: TonB-dependent receptor [Bacteroidia bacterium]|nr:TonB-dependent receptor [Bacteroidia bacterium]
MSKIRKLIISMVWLSYITCLSVVAQNRYTVSGTVRDAGTGEAQIGSTIIVKELASTGTSTNGYGFYSLTLPQGKYTIRAQFIGYENKESSIDLNKNMKLDFEIREKITGLKEVEVVAEKENKNVTSTEVSTEKIKIKEINAIPVLFGEKDILKTIQLLPGIKSVSEGNTGFYVRGGGADQNLILLDDANVYSPSHLLGFFSVFNSDAIKDVTVYKGGIPAEYGGRISSVLDIKMNDGNSRNFTATGGIGLISSRLTLEGPIIKNKGSFMISARRTYADLFLKLDTSKDVRKTSIYFYDLNLKANYQITDKDKIFLSGYLGRDVLDRSSAQNAAMGINWGNATGTLRWNHLFNDRLFLNSSLIYSNYNYIITLGVGDAQFQVKSTIEDFTLNENFSYFINTKNTLKFGFDVTDHTFLPGEVTLNTASALPIGRYRLAKTIEPKYAMEGAEYISDEATLGDRFKINIGLRFSEFAAIGPGTVYSYNDASQITDSTTYNKNQIIKTYGGIEPRFSVVYILDETSSLKTSYNRIYQYLHLLSNTTSETPVDLWVPSSAIIKPQIGDQVDLGYFKNFRDNTYEASVEIYYKNLANQIEYKPGADLRLNKTVESQLLFGKGWAYGSEFYIKKKYGRLNGWIGYTLSRSLRKFDGIDNGSTFPAKQDIIHDISIVGIYELNAKWTFSASWVYWTGNAVTFPSGKYIVNGQIINYYTSRNDYRMPPYHRLDVGATWMLKKTEKTESSWNFSIYNVYGRENAYSINFQPDPNDPSKMQAVQLSLFRWVPAITYNFKF